MKANNYILWIAFCFTSVLTWGVKSSLWMTHFYNLILAICGIASIFLGLTLIVLSRFSWRSTILVVLGLLIGQWWFIQLCAVLLIWRFRGFAP